MSNNTTTTSSAIGCDDRDEHRSPLHKLSAVGAALLILTGPVGYVQATDAVTGASVYAGPAPVWGGDPAFGETESSYFARTGDHLPLSIAIYGGDPVPGETEASYFARTGDHLPAQ